MTNDLLKLTDEITRDTADRMVARSIENNRESIATSLRAGKDYVLRTDGTDGKVIVIRSKRSA